MLNTGITSVVSLRARGSLSYSTNYSSHCSNVRRSFAYSSSNPCCSCCCSSIYSVPSISPSYGCSLYGLRQSSLIQWSPYRRLISDGFDYYSRLAVCDVDGVCYCDNICNFREKTERRRKGGLPKCLVYEERSEMHGDGSVDEVDVLLSLLTEDIGEETYLVRKESRKSLRKPLVERRENGGICHECGSKKKRVDVGVSESEPRVRVSSIKNDSRRRKVLIQSKEEEEALLRKENRKASLREERKGALLKKRTEREQEERESLLRKVTQKAEEKQERESVLRRENQKVESRTEEKEDLLRKDNHSQKLRKDGSSCSSYYSLSSNGDYVSDNEIELTVGRIQDDSSSGHQKNLRNDEIAYQDTREEDQRSEYYREDHGFGLTKKSSSKEFHNESSVVESDFRKKSEKKLADISVEEMNSRKEASLKESKSSMVHESNQEKSSVYSGSYDDRKVTSTESKKFDEELRQTGEEVSRQSETMQKYKQSVERQDIRSGYASGSEKVYSGKAEMSAKVASSDQETVGKCQALVGVSTREDEYHRNSRKVAKISEIQEIDIRKTSISQQRSETSVRAEDYSTNIHSSITDAKKQNQQYDQVSDMVESRGKSQQMARKDVQSILKTETAELRKQGENVNLASSSSLESKEPHSPILARITKRFNSRNESDELNKVLITSSGNSGALRVEDRNKNKSEKSVMPPPNLPETGVLSQGSQVRIATSEDAIGSASRLEKSSAHYVGEFVKQVKNEMFSSEIQREKETHETMVSHEESSGVSHSKDHDLGSDNQLSGAKGPSDEMWNVDELSVQEPSKGEVQDNASKAGSAIVKRTGRSLWNTISDIVLLRWSPHPESHSSGRKTGGSQSTSSGTLFSGHETEEHEEATEEKGGRSVRQGLSGSHQEEKITQSQIGESSSSSTSQGHLRHVGINAPSSSVIQGSGSPQVSISLPTGGETSGDTSSLAIVDSSIPLPGLRLRRSPAVQEVSEADTSDNGMTEQVIAGSVEQTESVVYEREVKQRRLQRKDQVVSDRFNEWEEAYRLEAEQRKIDEMFMREALLEAQKAADKWEVPVGSVLVYNGKIIARGCNLVEELRDSTAHAEIMCIREASNMLRTWRLSETTLYVTLEPCPMCAGAILQARIDTVVWGAPNKLLGADGSWIRLFPGDGGNDAEPSDKPPAPVHPFHPNISIRRGVLASDCADAMQQFFKRRRKEDKKGETPAAPPSCLPISNRPSKLFAKMHDAFHMMLCL
ncbi:hypothetical protein ACS0TY_008255 [Phlomoides rotata]